MLHAHSTPLTSQLPGTITTKWPLGEPFVRALAHGSMSVEWFEPKGTDNQQPHTQDELYFVMRGTSDFVLENETQKVSAGSVLFVPAGATHRFENFSADFATWVVFYGAENGE